MKKLFALLLVSVMMVPLMKAENGDNDKVTKTNVSVLSGKVTDKITGESLAGVKVQLEGTSFVAYTDFDGNFVFSNINPGIYAVSTSLISYEKATLKNIKVKENEVHSLNVNLSTVEK